MRQGPAATALAICGYAFLLCPLAVVMVLSLTSGTLVIGLGLLMVLHLLGLLATWPGLALAHLMVVLPFVVQLLLGAFATARPTWRMLRRRSAPGPCAPSC